MRFSIPWSPPSLNEWKRMHWRENDNLKQTVAAYLYAAIGANPRRPETRKAIVTVQIFRPKRRFDRDNCVPARKFLLDAMRSEHFGWLKNDSPVWCESRDLPCQLASEPRVEVTLEYVEAKGAAA